MHDDDYQKNRKWDCMWTYIEYHRYGQLRPQSEPNVRTEKSTATIAELKRQVGVSQ